MRGRGASSIAVSSRGWVASSIRSIAGILLQPDRASDPGTEERTEEVRRTMLALMATHGLDILHRDVYGKIRYADSLRSLWYVRSELMVALADERGEVFAQQRLAEVSQMFRGLLPEARHYRSPRQPR